MTSTWTDDAIRELADFSLCPRCRARLGDGVCPTCRADLRGEVGAELARLSMDAVTALRNRKEMIAGLHVVRDEVAPAGSRPPLVEPVETPTPDLDKLDHRGVLDHRGALSVQSVLAVAGAGLLAVAAIVFTFLNPDLTDFTTRTTIVAGVTVAFVAGAFGLARAGLRFSSEAVGALGVVFVVLVISSFSSVGASPFLIAGVGAVAASAVLFVLALAVRSRTWLWASLAGLAVAPAFFGYATAGPWSSMIGHLGVGFVALATLSLATRLRATFASPLMADRATATVLQLLLLLVIPIQLIVIDASFAPTRALATAGVLATLALIAFLAARGQLHLFWSFTAGALTVTAAGVLPLAEGVRAEVWLIALVPSAAAAAFALLTLPPARAFVSRRAVLFGAWTFGLFSAAPAATIGILFVAFAELRAYAPSDYVLVSMVGVASVTLATWLLSRVIPLMASVAMWFALLPLLSFIVWGAFLPAAQLALGIGIALALSVLVVWVPAGVRAASAHRVPLIVGAHAALLLVLQVASTPELRVVGGAAVVAAIAVVAQAVPKWMRPIHAGLGFALALMVFATALADWTRLDSIAVTSLTTSLAALTALVVTAVRRLSRGFWYAILLVTSVPFLIGIAQVLQERSGWTALSTAVIFGLAVALVVTRRDGMTRLLRSAAAALLLPALAVVVVCLVPQLVVTSGSPIVLPIIAAIIAIALPLTGRIATALARRGIPSADARAARLWIELSSLVTAAIAVLLALLRTASGLDTAFQVLAILGVGGLAVGALARRRYGWPLAGASFTGALWCSLAIAGVDVAEAYLLPPTLGAALVGAIAVARGLRDRRLYLGGLLGASVPSLVLLAVVGNPAGDGARTVGLFAGALLLVSFAGIIARVSAGSRAAGLRSLLRPTLVLGMVAASAGVIQALRIGSEVDAAGGQQVMIPALALSAAAALVAALAARLLPGSSRWRYAPAFVYLVAGPMSATRGEWFPTWTLWGLMLALLVAMVIDVGRGSRSVLPPTGFMFALAVATGIAAWSTRELLRVEAFSLPLGLGLLLAGIIAWRRNDAGPGSWPAGHSGSWRLLAPGILATLGPSIMSTGTDPRTERAILVIGLALVAILIGSLLKLAAPFILGIVVLPIENLIVFAGQLGSTIGAAPWWITLATAGAVLLVLAVTWERRVTSEDGVARLRDLR